VRNVRYRLPGGRLFSGAFVRNILEYGHIYTGRVAFYKASKGKFYQGNKNSPVPVKNLKGKARTKHNIDDWLISDEVFEPIVSMEEYHRAHDLLVKSQTQGPSEPESSLRWVTDLRKLRDANDCLW
jgi:hypothetical protein